MAAPNYVPELDLVALAPDGAPAAYCLCQIDHEQNFSDYQQKSRRTAGYPAIGHPVIYLTLKLPAAGRRLEHINAQSFSCFRRHPHRRF